jgi:hypothetical protein
MKTKYLTNNLAVIVRTIRKHAATCDSDKQGYCINNGTNRQLCSAIDTGHDYVIYAETNGNPVVLFEGEELDFVRLISDEVGGEYDTTTGLERLRALADELDCEDNAAADWLRDRITIAEQAVAEEA